MANNKRGVKRGRPSSKNSNVANPEKKAKKIKVNHISHGNIAGQVLCLGEGDTGQLGLGPDVMDRTKPAKVDLPPEVVQVVAGGMHSLCVTKQGKVFSWGCNDEGALGRRTEDEDDTMSPGEVNFPDRIVQVAAGDSHSAALSKEGRVFVFGTFRDANGKIGLVHPKQTETIPVEIKINFIAVKIASGGDHLAILSDAGDLYTMGCAEQGQLGRVAECFSQRGGRKGLEFLLNPTKVHFKKRSLKVEDVWTGQYCTYMKAKDSGEIYSWGLNNYFQLGFDDMKNRFVPDKARSFSPEKNWIEISGGQHHAIALDNKGCVYSIGRKEYGRLGLGDEVDEKSSPTHVMKLDRRKCIAVNSGSAVSFAVTDTGEIYAWGMGTSKQLGQTDDDEDFWEPVIMSGKQLQLRKGLQVSAGGQHTVILARDT